MIIPLLGLTLFVIPLLLAAVLGLPASGYSVCSRNLVLIVLAACLGEYVSILGYYLISGGKQILEIPIAAYFAIIFSGGGLTAGLALKAFGKRAI